MGDTCKNFLHMLQNWKHNHPKTYAFLEKAHRDIDTYQVFQDGERENPIFDILNAFFTSYGYFHATSGHCEYQSVVLHFPDKYSKKVEFVNSSYQEMAFYAFTVFCEEMEKQLQIKTTLPKISATPAVMETFKYTTQEKPYVAIMPTMEIEHWEILKENLSYVPFYEKFEDINLTNEPIIILNIDNLQKLRAYQIK